MIHAVAFYSSAELFLHLMGEEERVLQGGAEEDARGVEKKEDDHSQLNTM